jgi:hypothetical protein
VTYAVRTLTEHLHALSAQDGSSSSGTAVAAAVIGNAVADVTAVRVTEPSGKADAACSNCATTAQRAALFTEGDTGTAVASTLLDSLMTALLATTAHEWRRLAAEVRTVMFNYLLVHALLLILCICASRELSLQASRMPSYVDYINTGMIASMCSHSLLTL